jgi:acetoin utilization protein AcuC
MKYDFVIAHSDEYKNWVFSETHPTQGRRFIHAYDKITELAGHGVSHKTIMPLHSSFTDLARVHSKKHIDSVYIDGECNEWAGKRKDLGYLAGLMAGGSLRALKSLIDGDTLTAINFAGAKHHAMHDHSSGFGVFNDFALVADIATKDYDMKVAILDIDAHHGDGTEALTMTNPDILHYSVHEWGIFPGTGLQSRPMFNTYNFPLEEKSGDFDLSIAVDEFIHLSDQFRPDVIFVALGADGHKTDPLSSLQYTISGIESRMAELRQAYPETPMLIGGAGGYQPDIITPEIWAKGALALATGTAEEIDGQKQAQTRVGFFEF